MSAAAPAAAGGLTPGAVRGFLLRFAAAGALLGWLAWHGTPMLAEALLPWFRTEFGWMAGSYHVHSLSLDREGADHVVRIVVSLAHCIVLEGRAHCGQPGALANASTLAGSLSVPAVLLLALALAWPARRAGDFLWRTLAAGPALLLLWSLDLPFVLWASLWKLHVDAFAPGHFSPLLVWVAFLHGGGRWVLAAALGLAVATCPWRRTHG